MTIRVPFGLWARIKSEETGSSKPELRTRLRKRMFIGHTPVVRQNRIREVIISCNPAGIMRWMDVKMSDALKQRECACGSPGIIKNSDHTWTCADCQIKESKYSRCITSLELRRERNKLENEIEEAKRLQITAPDWN
jgi:hypothetical protein